MTLRQSIFGVGAIVFTCAGFLAMSAPQLPFQKSPSQNPQPAAVFNEYCLSCHNQKTVSTATASGVMFDRLDPTKIAAAQEAWEKVVRKLRMGSMPPQGAKRPDDATTHALIQTLETELDRAAALHPNPGKPVLRHLNRAEYANAIRDLLALDVDTAALLPPDDSAYGFDNIGDVLGVSPALLEHYLSAADRITELAVGDLSIGSGIKTYRVPFDRSQDQHLEGLPFGTVGGLLVDHIFPLDAEYVFQVRLVRTNLEMMRGMESPHQIQILVDSEPVFADIVGGPEDRTLAQTYTDGGDAIDRRLRVRVPIKAGKHSVGVTFVRKIAMGAARLQFPIRSSADTFEGTGRPHVELLTIAGPYTVVGSGETPSRQRIFTCEPKTSAAELSCARSILTKLARQAYRRPVDEEDLRPLMEFYDRGRKKGNFETGIQLALRRILASPAFVFRVESDPANIVPGVPYSVSGVELASRLSFFLWSSAPDDLLVDLGVRGRLKDPKVLEEQVRRMLADARSAALVSNFAGQWLQLRNLKNARPNSFDFPDFDDNLRQSLRRETELLFESMMREDRNVVDLLRADYTFIDERLARHYGIPGIAGSNFRRVPIADEARKGLLGQGSILTVTSHADRTSPVVRGKWILENLFGSPPPPPPPDVPQLKEDKEGEKPSTVRQKMEAHRANAVCASCHKIMDPLGLALENFDAVGAWRTEEAGTPIDAATVLSDGTPIDGVVSLRQALLRRQDVFVSTMTEKLMIYALGRGLTYNDMPAVRAIGRDAARQDNRFSSLILGVVRSTPFQMRVKPLGGSN
jgi:mono/diheme cytochrome c family protein